MPKEIIPIAPQLIENLRHAKANLARAQADVEAVESAIYVAAGKLPEEGTIHCTGVKIVLGYYQKWSDDHLQKVEAEWPKFSNLPFPFKKTYKADGKAVSYIRDNVKTAWDAISPALTLTPRKPSFTLEDEKE